MSELPSFLPSITFNHIAGCAQSKVSCLLTVGAAIIPPARFKTTNKCELWGASCTHKNMHAPTLSLYVHTFFSLTHFTSTIWACTQWCSLKQLREEFHDDKLFCDWWPVSHAVMCIAPLLFFDATRSHMQTLSLSNWLCAVHAMLLVFCLLCISVFPF